MLLDPDSPARASAARAPAVSPVVSIFRIWSRFDCPRRDGECENARTLMRRTGKPFMTPPLLVNHCTMSEHSLVIVIRTKQAVQPGGCKMAHSVRETPANTGLQYAFMSPIATAAQSPRRPKSTAAEKPRDVRGSSG